MIMVEQTLPAAVFRAQQMLVLFQTNLEAVKHRRNRDKKSVRFETLKKASRGFYDAREALVGAVYDEMSTDDKQCVRNVLVAAGLSRMSLDAVRFYYDPQPATPSGHWWLHVFYGGVGGPMGWYHGHVIAKVNAAGEVVSIKRHRRPKNSTTQAKAEL